MTHTADTCTHGRHTGQTCTHAHLRRLSVCTSCSELRFPLADDVRALCPLGTLFIAPWVGRWSDLWVCVYRPSLRLLHRTGHSRPSLVFRSGWLSALSSWTFVLVLWVPDSIHHFLDATMSIEAEVGHMLFCIFGSGWFFFSVLLILLIILTDFLILNCTCILGISQAHEVFFLNRFRTILNSGNVRRIVQSSPVTSPHPAPLLLVS